MKNEDIKFLGIQDLYKELINIKKEYNEIKSKVSLGISDNSFKLRIIRRIIARIHTELTCRKNKV